MIYNLINVLRALLTIGLSLLLVLSFSLTATATTDQELNDITDL